MSTLREEGRPQCGQTLIQVAAAPPWCPACEWNLEAYESGRDEQYLTRRQRKRLRSDHRRVFELNRQLFDELRSTTPSRPGWTRDKGVLLGSSVLLLLMSIACIVVGIVLVLIFRDFLFVPGVILVLIGIELRPRLPRFRAYLGEISRAESPVTYELIERVARTIGSPMPKLVVVDEAYNAACGRTGIRGRPFIVLGLPLWGGLTAQGRVALLGHELGHLINGDPAQLLLTQPALTTFGRLAQIFDPRGMVPGRGLLALLTKGPVYFVFWPIARLCWLLHVRMHVVAARDSRRGEYFADAVAADTAGIDGANDLADALLFDAPIRTAVRRMARTTIDPADWRAASAAAVAQARPIARRYEQRSIRLGAALFTSHPPEGFRARLFQAWPPQEPRLSISDDEWRASDAELVGQYRRVARALQN